MNECDIFMEALDKPEPAARQAYLDDACGADGALRQRVEALLSVHERASDFLKAPVAACASSMDAVGEKPGTIVGPYKLMEQIGEGGMGLVFVAEQQKPVRRKVALKLIKPGMDSKQVIARFEAERQALAIMDHPNIAKILDGGTTADGRPYFVMDLVKGLPITDYCDKSRLGTRQRLELFLDVCHAVQHAHQKGIIHRDLKPSNILVEVHDVRPVVKIIDFGISKAIGQQLTEKTLYTAVAHMIGTPMYMSPEQAGLSSLDVDTRSDVYSLGVLLYELLTGTTPFESEMLKKAGYDEMRRIIREDEPPRPSTRLSTLQDAALSTICERRGAELHKLQQQVRGELDWIVMKALEKDRDRRYESASTLGADIERYLGDEPVEACPPSAGYRLRKLVRRNRRVLVTAGVITMALVAATVVSAWQAVVARDAQRQAETDRKQAEADRDRAKAAERQALQNEGRARRAESRAATEAGIARAVNDFLQRDLLDQTDSAPDFGQDIGGVPFLTVREALDRASVRVDQRFHDQPLVEAAIRTTLGRTYHGLWELQGAALHLERAVAIRKAQLGQYHPDTRASMSSLAWTYQWLARHSEAIALRQQVLDNVKAQFGPDHPETLDRMGDHAEALQFAGQLDKCALVVEQLLQKRQARWGLEHPNTFGTLSQLAGIYAHMDRFTESIALFEKLRALRKLTNDHETNSNEMRKYAEVCIWAGKFDRAEPLLREALELHRKEKESVRRQWQLARTLGLLALSRLMQGRFDEAEPLIDDALALNDPDPNRHSYSISVRGAILFGQGKYAEAEPLLLQGYEGMKRFEARHPVMRRLLAQAGGWIVQLYEATNQPEKAQAWREKVKPKPVQPNSTAVK